MNIFNNGQYQSFLLKIKLKLKSRSNKSHAHVHKARKMPGRKLGVFDCVF